MNPQDILITALTPGTPFNPKGKIRRSVKSLATITGLPEAEIMGLLAGDLAALVACKPSNKGKGLLVALKAQLPAEQVVVAGGNAFVPPAAPVEGAPVLPAPDFAWVPPAAPYPGLDADKIVIKDNIITFPGGQKMPLDDFMNQKVVKVVGDEILIEKVEAFEGHLDGEEDF